MKKYLYTAVAITMVIQTNTYAQYIEWSVPAPSDHISGLGFSQYTDGILCLDSTLNLIYEVDLYNGDILDTISLPYIPNPPVGLACKGDTVYFAESGTAKVHGMTIHGPSVGVWDLSDSGPVDVSGLAWYWGTNQDWLLIGDATQNLIYRARFDNGFQTVEQLMDLGDCPRIHDIGGVGQTYNTLPVACEDSASPVRLYYADEAYQTTHTGDYSSAVGVTRISETRFYFSDPDSDLVHRYCEDMGSLEDTWERVSSRPLTISPNPTTGTFTVTFEVPSCRRTEISLHDLAGRRMTTMVDGIITRGAHSLTVECTSLPSGLYFAKLRAEELFSVSPVILIEP
ncbi:T9SS type A sorting domain-containing protein [Candidatus Fermentibacteria bacterium]|nr:T9SS type A sorting domain-containing protein [Candidatus Fermentibacteria bacterium]